MHATLFADTLSGAGLDPAYGAYLDRLPAATLATTNLISLFGLHRRWRGALVGHLALFEMKPSVGPMGRYAHAVDRFGSAAAGEPAGSTTCTSRPTPSTRAWPRSTSRAGSPSRTRRLGADVLWGARALLAIDGRWARHMMEAWSGDSSSLRASEALALR